MLRERPVGYVLAAVRRSADGPREYYTVAVGDDAARGGARAHIRFSTGGCAAGPFPPGPVTLRLHRSGLRLDVPPLAADRAATVTIRITPPR